MAEVSVSAFSTDLNDMQTREARRRLAALARFLDSAVRVPGTDIRVGLDMVLSIVPVAGSLASAGISLYLVREAVRFGISRTDLARMIGNVGVDAAIGAVPAVGFLIDAIYRANDRNIAILNRHLEKVDRIIEVEPVRSGVGR